MMTNFQLSYGTDEVEEPALPAEESTERILAGVESSLMSPPTASRAPEMDNCFGFDDVPGNNNNIPSRKAPVVVESTPLKPAKKHVPMAAAAFISPVAKPPRPARALAAKPPSAVPIKKRTSCSRPARLDTQSARRLAALPQPAPKKTRGKKPVPAAPALVEDISGDEGKQPDIGQVAETYYPPAETVPCFFTQVSP